MMSQRDPTRLASTLKDSMESRRQGGAVKTVDLVAALRLSEHVGGEAGQDPHRRLNRGQDGVSHDHRFLMY